MEQPVVIGLGEILWDMLPGGKRAGGAPVNFAYHAGMNHVEAWAISAVGDDELGRELLEVARYNGIRMMAETVDHPTGTVKVELDGTIPTFIICEDVAWDYIPLSVQALTLVKRASAISFGTLAQRSECSKRTIQGLVKAAPAGALKVFDINLRQNFYSKDIILESLEICNVLKINDEELAVVKKLFGLDCISDEDFCISVIRRFGLRYLILTAGASHSTVYGSDGKSSTIKTPETPVVDTVGAGDSFSGAFVAAVLNGAGMEEAHQKAVDAASATCSHAGAWK